MADVIEEAFDIESQGDTVASSPNLGKGLACELYVGGALPVTDDDLTKAACSELGFVKKAQPLSIKCKDVPVVIRWVCQLPDFGACNRLLLALTPPEAALLFLRN